MIHPTYNVTEILDQARDPLAWLRSLCAQQNAEEKCRLTHAFQVAQTCYGDAVLPDMGLPIFQHAVATAALVAELHLFNEAIIAALLFKMPLFKADWRPWITTHFGEACAILVNDVHQLQKLMTFMPNDLPKTRRLATNQAEVFRKMLLAMANDIRVVLIKLAWRTQTMYALQYCQSPVLQYRIAQETQWIFSPLANRLGIWQVKWFLEDYSFRYLEPEAYQDIVDLLHAHLKERQQYINKIAQQLTQHLASAGIASDITGRPKHVFSIWRKMHQKQLDFANLYDLFAVRLLVHTIEDCYTALGLVQDLWQPIASEFNDYITHPKPNGYQSLHTAVIGPDNKSVEVQIRTFAMHTYAELGVASHWRYKEGGTREIAYDKKIAWLRQLLGWQEELFGQAASHTTSDFQTKLFHDVVYVMTPAGHVIALPNGSTPIDFAYALHTDVGHCCRGAKIDGHIAPLSTALKNGQCVEILTKKTGKPSVNWLHAGWVKSNKAIAKIRQYIREQNMENERLRGKQLLDKCLSRQGSATINQQLLAEKLGFAKLDNLHLALGQDNFSIQTIVQHLSDQLPTVADTKTQLVPAKISQQHSKGHGILIEGVENLSTVLAKCCRPAPPDTIVGWVTKQRGISIHRQDCVLGGRLALQNKDRLLKATWSDRSAHSMFLINIEIVAIDRTGLLQDISHAFALAKLNVVALNTVAKNARKKFIFTVEVHHVQDLPHTINLLLQIPDIATVRRV
ncbi:MAG: bifunctional (p)ppGpp synthetase/guanosine-3',5'-bis(diphosphate) 3'-pyrophosphohydrolase [Neisseriales bacterium]|nr:MAG: bifunctional (p)ppGpp synthetase/guanosine-3',5'-bis(diphosphate) 3'-pyrophosphohydrolase [Neisseriales bacterium]